MGAAIIFKDDDEMRLWSIVLVLLLQLLNWSHAKMSPWGERTGESILEPGWTITNKQLDADGNEIEEDYHYTFVPKELFNQSYGKTFSRNLSVGTVAEYPGRPEGQCTSTGVQCIDLISNLATGFPIHITDPEEGCTKGRYKLIKDVYGRPMTMRFMHHGETLIKTREQVCMAGQADTPKARALESETLDDMIWRNLTIWAIDNQPLWSTAAKGERYVQCHALFASWHCSNVFPNCSAELEDRKPAMPCRELCLEMNRVCRWSTKTFFLPYELDCSSYPSAFDSYRACTVVPISKDYIKRVSAVGRAQACYFHLIVVFLAITYLH